MHNLFEKKRKGIKSGLLAGNEIFHLILLHCGFMEDHLAFR